MNSNTFRSKRVLVLAYSLSPVLGSEYRSAWNIVCQLSHLHKVTVLIGDSDGYLGGFGHVDQYSKNNILGFEIVKVHCGIWLKLFERITKFNCFRLFFPFVLRIWHKKAFRIAQILHQEEAFDVAHQLGPIGFRNPGYIWKLNCYTYWGPIGGAQYINLRSIKRKLSVFYIEALFRNATVSLSPYSRYISKAASNFDALSFATIENQEFFRNKFSRAGRIISDQGLTPGCITSLAESNKSKSALLTVTWAGTLSARKNVDALIDIVKLMPNSVSFNVCGDGPHHSLVSKKIGHHANVKLYGHIERAALDSILKNSDVLLITSVCEANTAILLEGLQNLCIPVVPDAFGFKSLLNNNIAYLVPQLSHEGFVIGCASAISSLASYETRQLITKSITESLDIFSWKEMAAIHASHYKLPKLA
jgi:glycosyltransferase involved in cell wall biosynthesis